MKLNKKRIIISSSLLGLALLSYAGLAIRSSAINSGKIEGCNAAVAALVPPQFNPQCGIRNDRLVVTVLNPILNIELTYDLLTGRILQDNE